MAMLQDAATTGNGTAENIAGLGHEHCVYVQWASGVTAGVVSIETARLKDYTGTWAVIATANYNAAATDIYEFGGAYKWIRARITTTVAGGSAPSVTVESIHNTAW